MKDRLLLAIWMVAVVAITFVHDPYWLAGLLALALLLAGRDSISIIKSALIAVALVNLAVSLGFVISASLAGEPWGLFVVRLNLRVLLLTFLTLWMSRHLDLVRAVDFSASLKFVVVLALGQIQAMKRLLVDYRQAFASRSPRKPSLGDRLTSSGRQATALLEKAEHQAGELNQGMRSRGFFDDRAR